MGDANLAETGDAVSAGYAADKNTIGTISLIADKRLGPATTTYNGEIHAIKSNLLGSSWGDIGIVAIETKELSKQDLIDIVTNARKITVSEINKGEFLPVAINHATPWDGQFSIELDKEKFYLLGPGHKFYSPQGATPRDFVSGDASGYFGLTKASDIGTTNRLD